MLQKLALYYNMIFIVYDINIIKKSKKTFWDIKNSIYLHSQKGKNALYLQT